MQHEAKAKEMRSTNIDFPIGIPIGISGKELGLVGEGLGLVGGTL